jgi:hypothetical protein
MQLIRNRAAAPMPVCGSAWKPGAGGRPPLHVRVGMTELMQRRRDAARVSLAG